MKDDIEIWDESEISGTKPIPILSLAYWMRTFCSLSLAYPWPIFYYPHNCVVILLFLDALLFAEGIIFSF